MTPEPQSFKTSAAWVTLSTGLLVTFVTFFGAREVDLERIQREFSHEVRSLASAVQSTVAEDIAVLNSFRSLFHSRPGLTRGAFRAYSGALLPRYPSLRAVSWIPRVSREDRAALEQQAQENGLPNFQISTRQEQGVMVRAPDNDECYPVYFIEPHEGNEAALGFDLSSNPTRLKALRAARDAGAARATGRILLVQEEEASWAELFFVPVYYGEPVTTEQRRDALKGFVSGVFRIDDVMRIAGAVGPKYEHIQLTLHDEAGNGSADLLHESALPESPLLNELGYQTTITFGGGRIWRLAAQPSEKYIERNRANYPWFILIMGVLMTGFFSHYVGRVSLEKIRIEQQVFARTRALAEANVQITKDMQERAHLQQDYASLTDHEQRRLGQELHDSLGQQVAVAAMLAKRLNKESDGEDASLNLLEQSILTSQSQIRALSKGLLPVEVVPAGLKSALGDLVASVNGVNDMGVRLIAADDVKMEDNATATQLYRIAQEALRNALEHGDVSKATIELKKDASGLQLKIRDNGKGLENGGTSSHGSGLSIMKHRAELIGGTLDIASPAGEGVTVTCHVPS